MVENTEKNTDKRLKNLIPWKEGDPSPNPSGRPKGQRNYATIRALALESLGKKKGMTPQQIEDLQIENGIARSINGDFNFFRYDLDKIHGKDPQTFDITTGGEKLAGSQNLEMLLETVNESLKVQKTNGNTHKGETSGA